MPVSNPATVKDSSLAGVQHSEEDRSILDWVSTIHVDAQQVANLQIRASGTCEWFLQNDTFREWCSKAGADHPVLWCTGFPGTGKTIMTAVVVEYLRENILRKTPANCALAVIYCEKRRSALELLASICRQLAAQSSELPEQLRKLHRRLVLEDERPGIDDTMRLVLALCDSFSKAFICIDAIDECDPNGEGPLLMSKFHWMRNHSARIFVTSRPQHAYVLDSLAKDRQLEIKPTHQDIRRLILELTSEDVILQNSIAELNISKDDIFDQVTKRCGDMFLLVPLLLDRIILDLKTRSERNPATGVFNDPRIVIPQGTSPIEAAKLNQSGLEWLQSTLQNIMKRESPQHQLASRILSWVVYAKRPLQGDELIQALTIGPEWTDTWKCEDLPFDGDLLKILDGCEGLVVIGAENGEFSLFQNWNLNLSSEQIKDLFPHAQEEIAQHCLLFLCLDEVIASDQSDKAVQSEVTPYPFKIYAKRYWGMHLKDCDDPDLDDLAIKYLCKIFQNPARWVEKRMTTSFQDVEVAQTDDETPLHKAAHFGLDRVLQHLLRKGDYDIDAKSFRGETALALAVSGGHTSTVQMLCQNGADLSHKNLYGYTLLHEAADKDDGIMVALLVNYGIDVNATGGRYATTPLHRAAEKNNINAASMLLQYGADIFATGTYEEEDAMRIAARNGFDEFVRLLVQYGFDLTVPTVSGDTSLMAAASSGSIPLVEYMIANGAQVFEVDDWAGGSPMHRAAKSGQIGVVKLLLDLGLDPFQEDKYHKSALREAITGSHQDIVELLLPLMSDQVTVGEVEAAILANFPQTVRKILETIPGDLPESFKKSKGSLIKAALEVEDEEMVEILLDRGALVSCQDENGWSPLHHAADLNSNSTQILLDRGADSNLRSKAGLTPVHLAAYGGHLPALTCLLNKAPDLTIRAADGSNALIAAAHAGKTDAVKLLLQFGAPISHFNLDGESVLHHAVMDKDSALVQLLLEHNVDVSIPSRKGGGALHLAAFKGLADIVQQLVDHGANVDQLYKYSGDPFEPLIQYGKSDELPWNSVGVEIHRRPRVWSQIEPDWTPLHSAACGGNVEVVEILLRHGAAMSARSKDGETPLHVAASAGHVRILETLLKRGANVSDKTYQGDTPLHCAALAAVAVAAEKAENRLKCSCELEKEKGHKHENHSKSDCVALLLDYRANPIEENQDKLIPLALAAKAGHEDVVRLLVSRTRPHLSSTDYVGLLRACASDGTAGVLKIISGAFNESDESRSAWHEILNNACLSGNVDTVSLALHRGAFLAKKTADGVNPLHHAIAKQRVKIVELLLNHGADLVATDYNGRNALHIASSHDSQHEGEHKSLTVRFGNPQKAQIVSLLLQHGAPVNHRTLDGNTAIHFAVSTGDDLLVETLLKGGASINIRNKDGSTPLHAAVSSWSFTRIIELLLANGACPTVQDHAGRTPLHLIRWKDEDRIIAELLLKHGAEHSVQARNGDRPIHRATRRGKWEVVKRLLDAGASVHSRGENGRTAIHVAAKYGHSSIVNYLIELGAPVNEPDSAGWTPLHYARDGQHIGVVSVLSKHGPLSTSFTKSGSNPLDLALLHGTKIL